MPRHCLRTHRSRRALALLVLGGGRGGIASRPEAIQEGFLFPRREAREFRLTLERLERGLRIEVREARKTLINGASEGRERHHRVLHPHCRDRDEDEPFRIPKRRPKDPLDAGFERETGSD